MRRAGGTAPPPTKAQNHTSPSPRRFLTAGLPCCSQIGSYLRTMARLLVLLCALLSCASALVVPAAAQVVVLPAHTARAPMPTMTSADKKAKAAVRKQKSARSAAKRFKVTATGKLLRHRAGQAHLKRKKRPQQLQKIRRIGQCDQAELKTYQKMLLVVPKRG